MKYTSKDFYALNPFTSIVALYPLQKLRRWYLGFKFFFGCLTVIRNPEKTDSVLRTAQALVTPARFAYALQHLKSLPGGAALFETKPLLPDLDIEVLKGYPAASLGFQYAQHMTKNNLDPNFYDVQFSDDITYAFYRYGKVHDLLHILTGFDTSIPDELGVLGYSFAQNRGPGLMLATSLTFLHGVFFKPRELYFYIQNFVTGWQMGQTTAPFFTHDWNRALLQPLAEVRAELGFVGKDSRLLTQAT